MKKSRIFFSLLVLVLAFSTFSCAKNESASGNEREQLASGEQTDIVNLKHNLVTKGEPGADKLTITIGATGDLHGRLFPYEYSICEDKKSAGLSKISVLVKKLREDNPNTILVDVGDTVQDNSAELFNDLETHPMIQAMNYMNYDVWALGNHEFNFDKEFLCRNIRNFKGAVLSANIKKTEDDSHFVLPYQLFNIEGVRVAVVGAVTPHIPLWEASSPSHFKGLKFEEPIDALRETIDSLEGKYDVLVGAFHLGRDGEYNSKAGAIEIAKQISEFDIIFAGHEHARFATEVEGKDGDKTWVIEPGCYGWALAVGNIEVAKEGDSWKVLSVNAENIKTDTVTESDKDLEKEFKFVHDKAYEEANIVIGTVTEDFLPKVDYITGAEKVTTMPTIQLEDTALMDLINTVQKTYAKADVSSAAAFRFEMNLKKGDFRKRDVAVIYKFPNTLMGVKISGEDLLKYMEWSASYYNTTKAGDVTISFNPDVRSYNYDMFEGINYDIDISKEVGNRIKNATINGEALDPKKIYKLAVNNYRFGTLKKLGVVTDDSVYYDSYEEMQDAGRIRDLIIKYVKETCKGTIAPTVNNNWKIIGFDKNVKDADKIIEKIKKGELLIPKSEDGRTLNVKSINVNEL